MNRSQTQKKRGGAEKNMPSKTTHVSGLDLSSPPQTKDEMRTQACLSEETSERERPHCRFISNKTRTESETPTLYRCSSGASAHDLSGEASQGLSTMEVCIVNRQ